VQIVLYAMLTGTGGCFKGIYVKYHDFMFDKPIVLSITSVASFCKN
jgi:hypothetical protein